jgi:hypothetical protein
MNVQQIVEGYLRHIRCREENDFWAWEEAQRLCESPASAVDICRILANGCMNEAEVAIVAADVFEEAIERFGLQVLSPLIVAGRECANVRIALRCTLIRDDHPAFETWKKAMAEFRT